MSIAKLIERIRHLPGSQVTPSTGLLAIEELEKREGIRLPEDLREFLVVCDGVSLFTHKDYPLHVHGVSQIVRANPVLVGEPCEYDRSYQWFLIGNDGTRSHYISIDLSPERLGRCYDSFWQNHGIVGSCAIVATSFSDLLERAIRNEGDRWWWVKEDFISLGDAYDT